MTVTRFALGSLLFLAFSATASMAQNGRTFVSGAGLDTNPCSVTSPCRTFGQAISVTNAGGEVVVLTSAGYGSFTITKAVTVEAPPGVYAGITVTSGDGIDINAGPLDTVILRGLTVNNQGGAGNGIVFNTGGTLHIESCIANGFSNTPLRAGILISGGGSLDAPGNILVKDTTSRGNGLGIHVDPLSPGSQLHVTMDHLHLDANNIGLEVETLLVIGGGGSVVYAAIRDSSTSGNTDVGMGLDSGPGAVSLDIANCLITNSNLGLAVDINCGGCGASATASLSNCTITDNPVGGFVIQGGGGTATIYSRGNNTITGSNSGALTLLPAQ
jgi:hypothetical protein